jgi:geranylgeranyl diphosphate synthase type 3
LAKKLQDEKLEKIKVITQMLHNASLMIDDIEDNSRLRRGIPVAHHVFGVAHVINSANFVYFQALQNVLELGHPAAVPAFSVQLLELHRGQGIDIYWRDTCVCPTEEEYKRMVKQKTGGLFKLAVDLMQLFSENKRYCIVFCHSCIGRHALMTAVRVLEIFVPDILYKFMANQ